MNQSKPTKRHRPQKEIRLRDSSLFAQSAVNNNTLLTSVPLQNADAIIGKIIQVKWSGIIESYKRPYYMIRWSDGDSEEMYPTELKGKVLVAGDPKKAVIRVGCKVRKFFAYKVISGDDYVYNAISTSGDILDSICVRKEDTKGSHWEAADIVTAL